MPRLVLLLLFALTPVLTHAMPTSFAPLVEKYGQVVVNISTATKPKEMATPQSPFGMGEDPFGGTPFEGMFGELFRMPPMQALPRESLGSGLIISPDGYIVTNYHVVEGADEIIVRFSDREKDELDATIIGKDRKNDLALLKVEPKTALPFAPLTDDASVKVGDWVLAIGNPFGLGGSVSAGIISAQGRNIGLGPYDNFIQTDAAINPGNSGGPLFNTDGEVVGINTAILSRTGGNQGISFAIPVATVAQVVDQLREFGRPIRGWLGVKIQTVTPELAEALGLEDDRGALIAGVEEGSPAAKAGLRDGDVIIAYDGNPILEMSELPKMVAETKVGSKVPVQLIRSNRTLTLQVKIAELDEAEEEAMVLSGQEAQERPLGLSISKLTQQRRADYGIADGVEGVLITGVVPGSPAYQARLQVGDVIVQVDQKDVRNTGEAARLLKQSNKAVLLLINRRGDTLFVAIKPE